MKFLVSLPPPTHVGSYRVESLGMRISNSVQTESLVPKFTNFAKTLASFPGPSQFCIACSLGNKASRTPWLFVDCS